MPGISQPMTNVSGSVTRLYLPEIMTEMISKGILFIVLPSLSPVVRPLGTVSLSFLRTSFSRLQAGLAALQPTGLS